MTTKSRMYCDICGKNTRSLKKWTNKMICKKCYDEQIILSQMTRYGT